MFSFFFFLVPGPMMTSVMKDATDYDMRKLYFMSSAMMNVYGIEGCRVTRCGYTGEDGIEVFHML